LLEQLFHPRETRGVFPRPVLHPALDSVAMRRLHPFEGGGGGKLAMLLEPKWHTRRAEWEEEGEEGQGGTKILSRNGKLGRVRVGNGTWEQSARAYALALKSDHVQSARAYALALKSDHVQSARAYALALKSNTYAHTRVQRARAQSARAYALALTGEGGIHLLLLLYISFLPILLLLLLLAALAPALPTHPSPSCPLPALPWRRRKPVEQEEKEQEEEEGETRQQCQLLPSLPIHPPPARYQRCPGEEESQ